MNTFPADWREKPCYLVAVPQPLVPYVGGLLKMLEQRGFWQTEQDYTDGYTATVELEACLMATCLQDLLDEQRAFYRMVNTQLSGQAYSSDGETPPTISPSIAPFVDTTIHDRNSVNGRLEDLKQLLDNALTGAATVNYNNPPSVREQLQSIIDSLAADDTDLTEIIDNLVLIVGALA